MEKKVKKVIKFEDLSEEALVALEESYPDGWRGFVKKIEKPNGEIMHAFNLDTEDASYLVKVEVLVDAKSEQEGLDEELLDKEAEKEALNDAKNERGESDGEEDED